jgi:aspartyl-tRNA(Asn)/glutamyl-tRNA(Gln) amidotransferase subunit A
MGLTYSGLPLSLQLVGRPFEETLLIKAGNAYQLATNWHLLAPPLTARATTDSCLREERTMSDDVADQRPAIATRLTAAGLTPSAEEIDQITKHHFELARGLAALYDIPELRYEEPALTFDPDATFVDWT